MNELKIEDIEKITTNIFKDMNEFNNWRWNAPITGLVFIIFISSHLFFMWVLSLFTKEPIYFLIFGVIFIILMIWFLITGADLVTLHIWMKLKSCNDR